MRMPNLFLSHGTPLNALYEDKYTQSLDNLSQKLPQPQAIIMLSAHGVSLTNSIEITASDTPKLIYDFSGFPRPLYELNYPCSGSPQLAQKLALILNDAGLETTINPYSGLDHGVWIPLLRLFPQAQVPVLQVYMPRKATPELIYAIGTALRSLREQGILLIGSGGATHNLRLLNRSMLEAPYDEWALAFMSWLQQNIQEANLLNLFQYERLAPYANKAHPTAEHLYPLFFTLGCMEQDEALHVFANEFCYGNLSTFSFFSGALAS